jgi:hypothetical protein
MREMQASTPDSKLSKATFRTPCLRALKSVLGALNLQTIGVALQTLATRLQDTNTPMDKMMLLLETTMTWLVPSP